ncbi:DUF362 domain-containing protein [Candidatus Eisenbacteria bacterium]|uniref:DUF362 domain-containing protein n=1 Tax=Eiseniibacteriota bacterium TaxID=2212470 RepID=A0ABV6YIF4_UNCEI
MKSIVSIREIRTYDAAQVEAAVRTCLEPLGGIGAFVRSGGRVLLKPNMLHGCGPERAITTHPSLLRAMIRITREAGARVLVGDNPGVGNSRSAARGAGYMKIVREEGAEWADLASTKVFDAPMNRVARRIALPAVLDEVDAVFTLPKLKTHTQLSFTGAVKNQFGLIPGTRKARYHYRMETREWLARLLVDINRIAAPSLAVMDAVVGMEGQGPSAGKPRDVGFILAGADLSAVDVVACSLVGLDPRLVPTVEAAGQAGFGATSMDQIEVVGDDWRALRVNDFENVRELVSVMRILPLPLAAQRWIRRQWQPRPRIIADACVKCGNCFEGCPIDPSAIDPNAESEVKVNDTTCIRCYCCHEFCPHNAIRLKPSRVGWLFRPLDRL